MCVTGLLGKLFNNSLVVPLGRLSYSVFLVNLTVMMMSQSSQRVSTYFSFKTMVRLKKLIISIENHKKLLDAINLQIVCFQLDAYIFDTFKSYLIGVSLYLVVEAPFGNLTRKLFGRG